jgi:hypothetical protein
MANTLYNVLFILHGKFRPKHHGGSNAEPHRTRRFPRLQRRHASTRHGSPMTLEVLAERIMNPLPCIPQRSASDRGAHSSLRGPADRQARSIVAAGGTAGARHRSFEYGMKSEIDVHTI